MLAAASDSWESCHSKYTRAETERRGGDATGGVGGAGEVGECAGRRLAFAQHAVHLRLLEREELVRAAPRVVQRLSDLPVVSVGACARQHREGAAE